MRILKINNIICDIDEQTSLGIDIQAYDIKEGCKRKVNVSNSFTIPKSYKNLSIFGFADNVNIIDNSIYNKSTIEYWIDNFNVVRGGYCYVSEISERINITIIEKPDFFQTIKTVNFFSLTNEILTELEYYNINNKYVDPFNELIDSLINSTSGIHLSFYFSNLFNQNLVKTGTAEIKEKISNDICLTWYSDLGLLNGSHFSIYLKDLFRFFELKFDVNLNINTDFLGNLFKDEYFNKIHIPLRDCTLVGESGSYWFEPLNKFYNYNNLVYGKDFTIYDIVNAACQIFNVFIQQVDETEFKFYRFDKLTDSTFVDFSGFLSGKPTFKPRVEGFAQNNYITWEYIAKTVDKYSNSKLITCGNKNLDITKDLFKIKGYIGGLIDNVYNVKILALNSEESIKYPCFLIDSENKTTDYVWLNYKYNSYTEILPKFLYIANHYGIVNEYTLIESALQYPKFYEIKKWLSVADIMNFDFFKCYWIRELNASFFVNKISGFNPDKSNEPVTLELLKVSERPAMQPIPEAWVDGEVNIFTDGELNIFY